MWFFVKIYTLFVLIMVTICLIIAATSISSRYYKFGYTDGYQARITDERN